MSVSTSGRDIQGDDGGEGRVRGGGVRTAAVVRIAL